MMTYRRRALLVLTVVLASCAYFNTWWMAKNEYKDAVEGGGYDFSDPYAQAELRGEPAKLVDSCIERCGKILLLHSGSSLVDDALLMMGNCFVLKGEYDKAMRKYDELLEIYASSDLTYEARYMKAYTLVREGKADKAGPILNGLIAQTEKKDVRERAAYLAGRIFHHEGDCEKAIELLTAYLKDFDDGKEAGKARLNLASCLAKSGMAEDAVRILEPISGLEDPDEIAATLSMGIAYRTLGEYDRSVEILSRVAEGALEDSSKARAGIEVANTLVEKGEFEAAIEALDEAAETAKQTAPLLSAEATYIKGLTYEKQLQDFDKAIETYATISQQKSEYALLAKDRHKALSELKSYREALADTIPDAPEQAAEDIFMMAEILIEDLGLEDEARERLKAVADSIPQTDFGAKAALRYAALLEAEGDTLARVYQRKVIEQFPNTVYANVARASLGLKLLDVIVEKPSPAAGQTSGEVGPPDSLATGAAGPKRMPPPSPVSADSAWANRRRSRPPMQRDGALPAKENLRPPPVRPRSENQGPSDIPIPGEETDLNPPSPADSSGADSSAADSSGSRDNEGLDQ